MQKDTDVLTPVHACEECSDEAIAALEPVQPLPTLIERSRIMGEYYRDLATNYVEYDRTKRWPSPPFPPQHWATCNDIR